MAKKIIRLTENDLTKLIKRIIKEEEQADYLDEYTRKRLKERGFKEVPANTFMYLDSPLPDNRVEVWPSSNGGWKVYKGRENNKKLVFDLPHDECDVRLDKLIGYDWRKGYSK